MAKEQSDRTAQAEIEVLDRLDENQDDENAENLEGPLQ
jgi:hypothetical protein